MGVNSITTTIPVWMLGVVSNGLMLLGSFWMAWHGLRQRRACACFLGTAVVFWTGCTIGLEVLSAFGAISAGPMVGWGAAWLMVGALPRWAQRGVGGGPIGKGSELGFSLDSVAGLGVLLAAVVILGMRSLLLAVKVVSDGPIYHLYFAARWWKAGRLFLVAAPFGENAATYFPANGDLWFTWLLASWGGDRLAKVGQAPFLLLAAVAAYGCARALGARRSASLVAACWFAASMPLLLFSFEPNVDTIFVAGYMMAVYFFLRAIHGDGGQPALWLGALAAGEAIGTKSVGVVFVPPLLALVVFVIAVGNTRLRTKIARAVVVLMGPLVTGGYWYVHNAILTGNPLYPLEVRVLGRTLFEGWYGPDAMRSSPYYLPFGEWGALIDTLMAVLDPRLVPLWVLAVVGAGFWTRRAEEGGLSGGNENALSRSGRRESVGTGVWALGFGMLAILNVALYWVCIPYRSQQRFMLQALGLAAVPLALLLDRWRWLRLVAAGLLYLHLLTPETWPFSGSESAIPWDFSDLVPNDIGALIPVFPRIERMTRENLSIISLVSMASLGGVLATSIYVAWAWCGLLVSRGVGRLVVASAGTAVLIALGYADVWLGGEAERFVSYPAFDYYLGWQQLEAASGPRGARVAYAGTNIPYYLFGKDLRNEVRYVNVDQNRDWLLHDYHRRAVTTGTGIWPNARPGWDRSTPDFEAWLHNLDAAGVRLLVVTRVNPAEGSHNVADAQGFPIERAWAESHPERFELIYGAKENDPWFRLYRVRASGRGQALRVEKPAESLRPIPDVQAYGLAPKGGGVCRLFFDESSIILHGFDDRRALLMETGRIRIASTRALGGVLKCA